VLITSVIVTRFLGADSKGIYVFMAMIGAVILPIMLLGIGNGIQYYISKGVYQVKEAAISTYLAGLVTSIAVGAFIFFLWQNSLFGETGNSATIDILLCFLISLPFDSITYTSRFLLTGDSQFLLLNKLSIVNVVLSTIILGILVFSLSDKLFAAAIGLNSVKIIIALTTLGIVIKKYQPVFGVNTKYLREIYDYGLKSWLGNIAGRANDSLDQLIIGAFVSPGNLGIYSVAYSVVNLLLIPSNAVSPVLFNEIGRANDLKKSAQLSAKVHKALFILVALMGIFLCACGYWLIMLMYGKEFIDAYIPMLILIPGMLFYAVSRRVLQKFLAANGYPLKTSTVQIVGAISGVGMYILLIPKYTIIGAAIGSTIAYLVSMLTAYFIAKKLVEGEWNFFAFSKSDIVWAYDRVKSTIRK